jgi:hypothetical protein
MDQERATTVVTAPDDKPKEADPLQAWPKRCLSPWT